MASGFLWGSLLLFLILAIGLIVAEWKRPRSEEHVFLVFLENSEEIAEAALRLICRKVRCCSDEIRVVVIDSGSTDCTVHIVRRLARLFPEIHIVLRNQPQSLKFCQPKLTENIFGVVDLRDVS